MVLDTRIDAHYVIHGPTHFLKEQGMLTTFGESNSWCDTNDDPSKGILYGSLMGSLLWSATLLLFVVF